LLEIFLNSRVPVGVSADHGLISDKCRGFFAMWLGISAGDLFFNRKYRGGLGPRCVDRVVWLGREGKRGDEGRRSIGEGWPGR
jgi:hypothetical protein